MQTVYFTIKFTSGHLKGLTSDGKISYPTIEGCMEYIRIGQKGIKAWWGNGRNAYKIVDYSFQKYSRD